MAQTVKHLSTMREIQVRSLGQEDPLQKEIATHTSILVWEIPWTEEPGSEEAVPGPSVFPSREPGVSGDFWGSQEGLDVVWGPPRCVWARESTAPAQGNQSLMWNPRVFADDARGWQCPFVLCLHPQGCLRRGVRASGPSQERTGESSLWLWCCLAQPGALGP